MRDADLDLHPVTDWTPIFDAASGACSRRILFAAGSHDPPRDVLDAARGLLTPCGAELHLLRVTPLSSRDFVPTVAKRARELSASLVILPAFTLPGQQVAQLVRAIHRPVLVARRTALAGSVLAATDLRDPRFPVVRHAGDLGRAVHHTVTAVHNVCPTRVAVELTAARARSVEVDSVKTGRQLQALVQVTRTFGIQTAVLTSALDPVDAILREALDRDASLIVVGTRLVRTVSKRDSVCVDVVHLAPTAVLVVPLLPEDSPPS